MSPVPLVDIYCASASTVRSRSEAEHFTSLVSLHWMHSLCFWVKSCPLVTAGAAYDWQPGSRGGALLHNSTETDLNQCGSCVVSCQKGATFRLVLSTWTICAVSVEAKQDGGEGWCVWGRGQKFTITNGKQRNTQNVILPSGADGHIVYSP